MPLLIISIISDQTVWGMFESKIGGLNDGDQTALKLEISDGTGRPADVAELDTDTHTFTMFRPSHQYELISTLTSLDSTEVHSHLVVQVSTAIDYLILVCVRFMR